MTQEILKSIVENQPYPTLFAALSGAHLYGFPSPDSDFDVRGVHCLPLNKVLGLNVHHETLEASREESGLELDLVTHDVKPFFLMLLKKNGNVLEQIYSPHIIHTTPEHDELRSIAEGCITRFFAYHYLGFSRKKWEEFEKQTPKRIKTLLYVYRVLLTGIHLMQTGVVEANLVALNADFQLPYIADLIAAKVSEGEATLLENADVDFHQREYERLLAQLENAKETTALPDNPTREDALNDLLIRVRLKHGTSDKA